jgi:hypothetical protein
MEQGQNTIASALSSSYWPKYDRTSAGLTAIMEVSAVRARPVGSRTIVS